ncbi:SDR family NAD(P)-dependent oxidoreductase [Marinimicrobium sp. ARAG 43.8]|uniref:SDR family NAD(P)-dependent oxidoreductase n=1 Tax=Marinimicrobium sp. ARAG 43.8 TaxID=3418719 RepID=UPI003CF4F2A3
MTMYTRYASLAERSVFITGGATGIGACLVEAFVAQGSHVAFVDINREAGDALVARLAGQSQGRIEFRECDVTRIPELRAAIRELSGTCGDFTVLVNNVANDQRYDPRYLSEQAWYNSLAINLHPAFFAAQTVQPMMARQGGGVILNFSSINALSGPSKLPSYNTAKAALLGLTKSLARDFGTDKIRVNAIVPGWVITERQLNKWLTPEAEAWWMDQVCLKERLLPEDVAKLTLYLASDDARMITGQKFVVDGGRL